MGNNDFTNIGDQIRDAVQDAVESMNFNEVNKIISGTISEALDEVNRHLHGGQDMSRDRSRDTSQDRSQDRSRNTSQDRSRDTSQDRSRERSQDGGRKSEYVDAEYRELNVKEKAEVIVHPPSRVTGILFTVFGSIGLGLSLTILLVALIVALLTPSWVPAGGLAVLMAFTAALSGILLGTGNYIRGKVRRLKLYLLEAGGKSYCSIRALVGRTGKPERFVIRDLKRMIRTGILPHAHIDEKNTCLMLNDSAYKQYRLSMEALRLRTEPPQKELAAPPKPDHKTLVIQEGRAYLDTLRQANQAIPGEKISAKLFKLEAVVEKIFHVVDMHPGQLDDIERFIDYYLPTTVKLVTAYQNFDSVGIAGENIAMAKREVEQTLDTINLAFERLLDDLYRDEAFDVSTDASVLQAMLKKDGFVNSDFERTTDLRNGGTNEPR